MSRASVHPARGFTLVECLVVLLILGILSVGAIPALGAIQNARAETGADRVRSELFHARSLAMATGDPVGVVVDLNASTVRLMTVRDGGLETVYGPLGEERGALELGLELPGVAITGFTAPDGGSVNPVWFGFTGVPELRDASGDAFGGEVGDATIEIAGGPAVRVIGTTGAITR